MLGLLFLSLLGAAPEFEVEPFIQPGDAATLAREQRVVLWQTRSEEQGYAVEYGALGEPTRGERATAVRLPSGAWLHEATLGPLRFDATYRYRVRYRGTAVFSSEFETRTRGTRFEFAVIGDSGDRSKDQARMAVALNRRRPAFIVHTGDYVYSFGRGSEYLRNLFPFYNASRPDPEIGAPLLRSIPVYVAFGNHDFNSIDLRSMPDGLAGFHYCRLPLNGPALDSAPVPRGGGSGLDAFLSAAGSRWPRMANYSFDVGNAHFAILDGNVHANPRDPRLLEWLRSDLGRSGARWKLVAFHHPGFHSSRAHYDYQKMRLLAPEFESLGVDVVFSGHVHNYQRSRPLRFAPESGMRPNGNVPGRFTIDETFDGRSRTRPDGVIYIVSGAGGASLYDPDLTDRPDKWERPGGTWAPFTAKFVSDRHSFTSVRIDGRRLECRQLDAYGSTLDRFQIEK